MSVWNTAFMEVRVEYSIHGIQHSWWWERKLEVLRMWGYRKLLVIKWNDEVRNEEVIQKTGQKPDFRVNTKTYRIGAYTSKGLWMWKTVEEYMKQTALDGVVENMQRLRVWQKTDKSCVPLQTSLVTENQKPYLQNSLLVEASLYQAPLQKPGP